jgi:hypothetical protein
MNLYNYDKSTFEKIQTLVQGFYLSYDSKKSIILTIKSHSGLISSLVKGCPINLYLTKDDKFTTLYIMDNERNPQYFKGSNFSKNDTEYKKFESIVINLIKDEKFTLIVMNETHYQIINAIITKENSFKFFNDWLCSEEKVFEIQLSNISFTNEKKLLYIDSFKNRIWDDNLINNKPYFNFDEYLENGNHGYHQEFSFRNVLSEYYEPNVELFHSIFKLNGEEFTDFVIIYEKAVVLIESKYTISSKQTMFNKAISKAIKQLNAAERIIFEDPHSIDNNLVNKELFDFKVILKICVFYDDGRDLLNAFQNFSKNYDPVILPLFISIDIFHQFASYLKIRNNDNYYIIENLLRLRIEYRKKNKIMIIDGFDINTGALSLII